MNPRIFFCKKQLPVFLLTSVFLFIVSISNLYAQANKNQAKVNALVKKMTLEEKVGQMAQVSIESLGKVEGDNFVFDPAKLKDAVENYKIGSILNSPGIPLKAAQWNIIVEQIQNAANETKNKIPVLYEIGRASCRERV